MTEIEELQSQNQRIKIVLEQTLQKYKITLANKADSYERLSEDMKKPCNETLEIKKKIAKVHPNKLKDANV